MVLSYKVFSILTKNINLTINPIKNYEYQAHTYSTIQKNFPHQTVRGRGGLRHNLPASYTTLCTICYENIFMLRKFFLTMLPWEGGGEAVVNPSRIPTDYALLLNSIEICANVIIVFICTIVSLLNICVLSKINILNCFKIKCEVLLLLIERIFQCKIIN